MKITLQDLVELVAGELVSGPDDVTLTGYESLKNARNSDVSFCDKSKYAGDFSKTNAAAVIVSQELLDAADVPETVAVVLSDDPAAAFDKVVRKYGAPVVVFCPGIHSSAVIGEGVVVDPTKSEVCANAVIGSGVTIGDGTRIGA